MAALPLALGLALGAAPGAARAEWRAKFELFVDDVEASTRFYETLGFRVAHVKPSDRYTTMERDGVVVALSPLPRWLPPLRWLGFLRLPPLGTEIVLYPDDLETLRASLVRAGYSPGEVRLQPWGQRDFRLRDPSGYYVRLSEGGPIP
ncbi:MAG TPA: VOC family protein [Myxococcota bacterium]|nr:VOC family protein [Myxococcota bacterium]